MQILRDAYGENGSKPVLPRAVAFCKRSKRTYGAVTLCAKGRNRYRDSRCAGWLADSVTTRESINRGKARELRIRSLRCQHPYLRPLSMSYDGSVKCRGSPASTSCDVMSNVIQEISVPRRASRGRRCLHVSHSCLAAFRPRSRTGLQLSVETHVLPFCSSHWSHKSPQNYFPLFTQDLCQHAWVACGARRFQSRNGLTRLKAPSTWSLDARSVLISVRSSVKPS